MLGSSQLVFCVCFPNFPKQLTGGFAEYQQFLEDDSLCGFFFSEISRHFCEGICQAAILAEDCLYCCSKDDFISDAHPF